MPKIEDSHINPLGFREYDARWLYPKDINPEGIKIVGYGLGFQIFASGVGVIGINFGFNPYGQQFLHLSDGF